MLRQADMTIPSQKKVPSKWGRTLLWSLAAVKRRDFQIRWPSPCPKVKTPIDLFAMPAADTATDFDQNLSYFSLQFASSSQYGRKERPWPCQGILGRAASQEQIHMHNRLLMLIAIAGLVGTEAAWACERSGGGGSATFAQRSMPNYAVPRVNYALTARPYIPTTFPMNYWGNPGYMPNYAPNYFPNDAGGQYPTSPVANYSPGPTSSSTARPARLIAPSLPQQQEAVSLPIGTNRMRFLAVTVTGMNGGDADRIEQELGKIAGVKGVNVKRGNGPTMVKVWYSDKEPVAMADVIAEVEKLGFKATAIEG
jgi:hypothetical protein